MSDAAHAHGNLAALCTVAGLHQVAADPALLAHQLGLSPSDQLQTGDLLRAAKKLGLKAKISQSTPDRLPIVPLPALALLCDGSVIVLAQCDGQRVLLLPGDSSRPVIEAVDAFACCCLLKIDPPLAVGPIQN